MAEQIEQVKGILSIDFDYIMFPCINLYNDITSGGENATVIWEMLKRERGISDEFLLYDPKAYRAIIKLIKTIKDKDKNIELISITEHDELVSEIALGDETKYDLVNIDFHHDIMYRPTDRKNLKNFGTYNCSNWVGYLMLNNKINSYTWIKAPNSSLYDHKLDGTYDIKFETESIRAIEDLDTFLSNHCFDKIFLCFSPQWVPYKYKHLYDLIIDLFG